MHESPEAVDAEYDTREFDKWVDALLQDLAQPEDSEERYLARTRLYHLFLYEEEYGWKEV